MTWRVLIAEDEFLIALDLQSAFQDAGAQVVGPVRRVDDALALPLDRFDAAVLDLELEDEELCRNLGDAVDQAAWLAGISMTSTPFWNLTPRTTLGN